MGIEVWNILAPPADPRPRHGGATVGMAAVVMKAKMAELLEVDEVLVGESQQTNNPGAAESVSRVWGKHFGIARVASGPTTRTLHPPRPSHSVA